MNEDRLAALGRQAMLWAKTYTRLVEALQTEGVTEDVARREARAAANLAAFLEDAPRPEDCPECGEEGGEIGSMKDQERMFMCRCGETWSVARDAGDA